MFCGLPPSLLDPAASKLMNILCLSVELVDYPHLVQDEIKVASLLMSFLLPIPVLVMAIPLMSIGGVRFPAHSHPPVFNIDEIHHPESNCCKAPITTSRW